MLMTCFKCILYYIIKILVGIVLLKFGVGRIGNGIPSLFIAEQIDNHFRERTVVVCNATIRLFIEIMRIPPEATLR